MILSLASQAMKSQEWVEKKRVGYTWFVPFFQRFYKLPDLINCLFLSY